MYHTHQAPPACLPAAPHLPVPHLRSCSRHLGVHSELSNLTSPVICPPLARAPCSCGSGKTWSGGWTPSWWGSWTAGAPRCCCWARRAQAAASTSTQQTSVRPALHALCMCCAQRAVPYVSAHYPKCSLLRSLPLCRPSTLPWPSTATWRVLGGPNTRRCMPQSDTCTPTGRPTVCCARFNPPVLMLATSWRCVLFCCKRHGSMLQRHASIQHRSVCVAAGRRAGLLGLCAPNRQGTGRCAGVGVDSRGDGWMGGWMGGRAGRRADGWAGG